MLFIQLLDVEKDYQVIFLSYFNKIQKIYDFKNIKDNLNKLLNKFKFYI